jgi:hypothetical protein
MANLNLRVGALGKDEARGIASNAVKLPELLRSQTDSGTAQEHLRCRIGGLGRRGNKARAAPWPWTALSPKSA